MSTQKPDIKKNILANFAGQGWSFVVGMVAIPIYIRYLGIEGYGLIGFYMVLHATFNAFLDFGLSVTINRELARYTALTDKTGQARDLIRTTEVGYWMIGLLIGTGVALSAPLLAEHWIQVENIPLSTVKTVVVIMGLITFAQWPLTLYQGGLIGLQQMVLLNEINAVFVTLRAAGAILLLWFIAPSLILYFLWQAVISLFQVGVTAWLLWQKLPPSDHAPAFKLKLIMDTWRFMAGMGATYFTLFILEQADKLILSKILSLELFGYYALATTLNSQFQLIGAQITTPLFPRFSALVASGQSDELRSLYHKSSQLVSVVILPVAVMIAIFSPRLIQIWTQDPATAARTAPIVSLLFISTALYNLIDVPYVLSIANGWTRLGLFQQLISAVVLVPLMIVMALSFGGVGAALTRILLSLSYVILIPPIVHNKFRTLLGELKQWYVTDVGLPLLAILVVAGFGYWLIPKTLPTLQSLLLISLLSLTTFGAAVLSARDVRGWAFEQCGVIYRRINPA
jgi:O-antigen/teichoic acid export membrane protein